MTRKLKSATVDQAIHILASMLCEAMAKRKRGEAAQNEIDAIHALRQLYDEQRKAWRSELASLKGRVTALEQRLAIHLISRGELTLPSETDA